MAHERALPWDLVLLPREALVQRGFSGPKASDRKAVNEPADVGFETRAKVYNTGQTDRVSRELGTRIYVFIFFRFYRPSRQLACKSNIRRVLKQSPNNTKAKYTEHSATNVPLRSTGTAANRVVESKVANRGIAPGSNGFGSSKAIVDAAAPLLRRAVGLASRRESC